MTCDGFGDVFDVTGDGTGAGSYHTSPSSGGICASDNLGLGHGVSLPMPQAATQQRLPVDAPK